MHNQPIKSYEYKKTLVSEISAHGAAYFPSRSTDAVCGTKLTFHTECSPTQSSPIWIPSNVLKFVKTLQNMFGG